MARPYSFHLYLLTIASHARLMIQNLQKHWHYYQNPITYLKQ